MAVIAKNKCTQSEREVYFFLCTSVTLQVPCSVPKEVIFSVVKI